MLIGILSDSHGRVEATRRAVTGLTERGAELLIHLGDLGGESVIDELIGHQARIVLGNCDWDVAGLTRHAECMGVRVDHPLGVLDVDGRRIAYTHGHLPALMKQAVSQGVDYLLHGHTHEVRDEKMTSSAGGRGGTRIINPGALCRAIRYTAAILDPGRDRLDILDIGKE